MPADLPHEFRLQDRFGALVNGVRPPFPSPIEE
jgi:hypothetical protein